MLLSKMRQRNFLGCFNEKLEKKEKDVWCRIVAFSSVEAGLKADLECKCFSLGL